ncbi:hypothetical protein [Clostridium sp.]|uniref:hypothetical protein n=1 Tax=Clostridium sp. TaxID=1506 RepID=UPI001A5A6856|nr:hypothetical protein [Clostridium sp.]MBK5234081.1 hypothetical protein [Clostridium sp.]
MGIVAEIKANAKKSNAKIQSSEADKFEKLLNRTFFMDKNIEEETKFVNMVMTRGLETQERKGLHASAMICPEPQWCTRQQVLSLVYKMSQGEDIPVGLMRIFEEGNAIHEKWQRLFIRGGYGVAKTMDRTRMNKEYMISYSPDIICKIPELFGDEPIVGEVKSVNTFSFKKMTSHASGHKQLQFYLYLTGYKKGFVLCDDKNCQEFKLYIYDYEPETVAPFIDRCEDVKYHYEKFIDEGILIDRCDNCDSANCKKAKNCGMRNACWDIGFGKIKLS